MILFRQSSAAMDGFLRLLCLSVCSILAGSYGLAQNDSTACSSSLSGKVLDKHDNSELGRATITIIELNKSVLSDFDGSYSFSQLCDGNYLIRVAHIGCDTLFEKVRLRGNTTRNFTPEHHSATLGEIRVSASFKVIPRPTLTKSQVSEEKLEQSKGLSLGEALKSIPGVNSLNTGNSVSKPVIHGMHSNRVLVLNNEIRQEGQQWGVEHAPEIDPMLAGELSVVKGANSIRYGSDAIAGVIVVDPKPYRKSPGVNGELNLVGMSNGRGGNVSGYIDGVFKRLPDFYWRVQGTLKQNGNASAPDYFLGNTGLKEYNGSYTLGWDRGRWKAEVFYSQFNTTLGILGASHIGNLTDLKAAFEQQTPVTNSAFSYKIERPYQHIEHELVKAKFWTRNFLGGEFSLIYARQYNLRYEFDKHRPLSDSLAGKNHPELQFELTSHTADAVWKTLISRRFKLDAGVSGITQGNTYEGRALIPNFRNWSGGAFAVAKLRAFRLDWEAGLRYDYKQLQVFKYVYAGQGEFELISPVHRFENLTGNIGAAWRKDSTINATFNLGSAWRAPSVSELYSQGLHHGAAAIEYGSSNLKAERAYNAILTLRYTPTRDWMIEVSPYTNYINGFIYRQPLPEPVLTVRSAFPGFVFQQANALLSGIDIYASRTLNKGFEVTAKGSVLRARNLDLHEWLIQMPADRCELELTYRFKEYRRLTGAYLSGNVQYVNKQWRVPANVDFAGPPPAYFLVNLHASTSIRVKQTKVEIGLSALNLLNTTYRDYMDRFRYFADAPGRNIILRMKVPFTFMKKTTANGSDNN